MRPTRRSLLTGSALVAAGALVQGSPAFAAALAQGALRQPGSRPRPDQPAGTKDPATPYDHIVVLMMENHSFDNYFGMLSRQGQPQADGFTFDAKGKPTNSNPVTGGHLPVFHLANTCQAGVSQSWSSSHHQINGGKMDGFAKDHIASMGYWDSSDIPFYYSLASTFTLADRWFCSTPCQTYPNRRFLYAATANGIISTDSSSYLLGTPNGTLWDTLSDAGVSWRYYFTDLPAMAIINGAIESHVTNLAPSAQFFLDAAAGTLPAVSFIDPEFGLVDQVGSNLRKAVDAVPIPLPLDLDALVHNAQGQGGDEESPQDISLGENFVARVANAILTSPVWSKTLFVWTYDEHGGYYDHVPPPTAIAPDGVKPVLGPNDPPGDYTLYGPRVPTVVMSPWSKPKSVSSVVHDHTSILAEIQKTWNLPALSLRDANAADLSDFLDVPRAAFLDPPTLAAAGSPELTACDTSEPKVTVVPDSTTVAGTSKTHPTLSKAKPVIRTSKPVAPTRALAATGGHPGLTALAAGLAGTAAVVARLVREQSPGPDPDEATATGS